MKPGVLFDLDGTLLDTSEDLRMAANHFARECGHPEVAKQAFAPIVSFGLARALKDFFNIEKDAPEFAGARQRLSDLYSENICVHTQFFPEMDAVLTSLERAQIPWGIVTNKLAHHTLPLLNKIGLRQRTPAIVCGDTLAVAKPHPQPLLHACELLGIDPAQSFYVGDASTDIEAGRAAGMTTIAAAYGFIPVGSDVQTWEADHVIQQAGDLHQVLAHLITRET